MTDSLTQRRRELSRRSLAKGAAWSVPLVAIAASAPAIAASRPPGLNGWVTLSKDCYARPNRLEIDGVGSFSGGGDRDRGLWVFGNAGDTLANAYITFYISNNVTPITWTRASDGSSMWSIPTSTPAPPYNAAPAISGYTAYTTVYSGTFTWNSTYQAWVAVGQPHFYGATSTSTCPDITSYAYRSVIVNNQTVTFTRGPITV